MMAIVSLAYVVALRTAWKSPHRIRPITFADQVRFPAQSLFRQGLAIITARCGTFIQFIRYLFSLFNYHHHPILKNVQ